MDRAEQIERAARDVFSASGSSGHGSAWKVVNTWALEALSAALALPAAPAAECPTHTDLMIPPEDIAAMDMGPAAERPGDAALGGGAIIAAAVQVVSAYKAARQVAADNPDDPEPILRPEGLAYRVAMKGLLDAVGDIHGVPEPADAAREAPGSAADAFARLLAGHLSAVRAEPDAILRALQRAGSDYLAAQRQEDDDA